MQRLIQRDAAAWVTLYGVLSSRPTDPGAARAVGGDCYLEAFCSGTSSSVAQFTIGVRQSRVFPRKIIRLKFGYEFLSRYAINDCVPPNGPAVTSRPWPLIHPVCFCRLVPIEEGANSTLLPLTVNQCGRTTLSELTGKYYMILMILGIVCRTAVPRYSRLDSNAGFQGPLPASPMSVCRAEQCAMGKPWRLRRATAPPDRLRLTTAPRGLRCTLYLNLPK
ncbi:hypothetical protein VTN77DRAFT_4379 [Rasamsonia byssochlamydoides]|uniref:uncharacterized protein n=1 Tax=Rasamsonia byssochlamydoides TaxID=89139 RepID=UPI00374211FA